MIYFINTVIYLLAIFGIVITSMSIYEMFDINNSYNTYRIFSKNNQSDNDIKLIVKLKNIDDIKEKEIVSILDNNDELKSVFDEIIIEKED